VSAPPLTPLAAAALRLDHPPERVLVLGCGDGDPVLFLAREFRTARIRGLDRAEDDIRAATARVGLDPEGRVAFKQGGGRTVPFPDEHFDLLVAVDVKPSPGEVRRVLRPGGSLLLVATEPGSRLDPGSGWLWRRLRRHGIGLVERATAGDGSFSVGRLDGGEATAASN
jgi:ubiquinone/menaquinone biosynthesis C-methylase UbiE